MIEMAVTDAPGVATLYCLEQRQGDSSIFDFSDDQLTFPGDRVKKLDVPATSLDSFFDNEERIDLIRIDAEGAEPLVFDGMRRILERNPHISILIELFPERIRRSGLDPAEFLKSIAEMGFRIQTVGPKGRLQQLKIEVLADRVLSELFLSR